jgi:type I restriction enzyme, R subunit
VIQQLEAMQDYDLYDVLAEIGYGLAPRTRGQRAEAFEYKHAGWLGGMPTRSADVLRAIVAQFAKAGTDGLENQNIFQTPDVRKAGGKAGAVKGLQDLGKPVEILMETKSRLFAA